MSDAPPTETLQDRLDRTQELAEFAEKCKKQLDDIFESLGWSQDYKGSVSEPMEQCPYDPGHTVPTRSMEKHKASCRLRRMGYSAEEQAEMLDPSVCYENSSVRSFTMDKDTQHQAILKARSAAPLMRMEGVFWQATAVSIREELGGFRVVSFKLISFDTAGTRTRTRTLFPLRVGKSFHAFIEH